MRDELIARRPSTGPRQLLAVAPNLPNHQLNSPRLRTSPTIRLTWGLALLATLTFELVAADDDVAGWLVALTVGVEALTVVVLNFVVQRFDSGSDSFQSNHSHIAATRQRNTEGNSNLRQLGLLLLGAVPFAVEVLIRSAAQRMLPVELLALAFFRNLVLVLAVFSYRQEYERMCCSLSTFLIIFATSLSMDWWLSGLTVAFAILGVWWLMGSYWESLTGQLAPANVQQPSRSWMYWISAAACLLLLAIPVASNQTEALRGFMPTSGGTEWYSENARGGVGDGDALVAGVDHIQSFAPIEDAPFATSHQPSLYDLFDDTYDESVKPQEQDRAIALTQKMTPRSSRHELAESKQAGKEFSTLRKFGKTKERQLADRDSDAILYVKGRLPVHLKLEVFDQYDGIDWIPESLGEAHDELTIKTLDNQPWLKIPFSRSLEIYSSAETHSLKVIRLDTNRIPAPTQLIGINIDKVDRADFFQWAQPGIVRMDREKLPSLAVVNVQSRVVDERLIDSSRIHLAGGKGSYHQMPNDEQTRRIRKLAREWTADTPYGWPQVAAIVAQLRANYVLDPGARPNPECLHTVCDFLFESRRGPDYLFASSAVQLLRSLGYSARLTSGFYVPASHYDPRARHAPVLAQDVHFWAEVHAGTNHWLPIEPTPGYELLKPPPTYTERLLSAFLAGWNLLCRNLILILLTLLSAAVVIHRRWRLLDRLHTILWKWRASRQDRKFVLQTMRLLDRRCDRLGCSRHRGTTITKWLQSLVKDCEESDRQIAAGFLQAADWAAYAPATSTPPAALREICLSAEQLWSWENLRRNPSLPSAGSCGAPGGLREVAPRGLPSIVRFREQLHGHHA